MIDGDLMQQEAKQGRIVNAWTVNEVEDTLKLRDLGVHGIMTDYPDVMLNALKA